MPSFTYQPLTELEAVNVMLGVIGEAPVSSLDASSGSLAVAVARQVLYDTSRAVQSMEWHFNAEKDYPIVRDVAGYLVLPQNALSFDVSAQYQNKYDLVKRDGRLYDRILHTNVFTENITVDVVFFLQFSDLPQPAREYITIRAARVYQKRMLSSQEIDGFTADDEVRAKATLEDSDQKTGDYNMLNGNYSVARVIDR